MKPFSVAGSAGRDLNDIWLHIAMDDPDAASHQVESFYDGFRMLGRFPEAGRLRPELAAGIRSLRIGSYVVLYRLGGEGEACVRIERVVHSARDLPGLASW